MHHATLRGRYNRSVARIGMAVVAAALAACGDSRAPAGTVSAAQGADFALDGALYLFDVDAAGDVPQLRVRRGAVNDLAFGEPVTLLYGARRADLIAEAGKLVVL